MFVWAKLPAYWQGRFTKSHHETDTFLVNLLLLCGDISLDPGQGVKHLCAVCNKPVKPNQKAIQCNYCDRWHHTRCCEMNNLVYDALADSFCMWICCDCGLPSFSSSFFDSSSEVQTSNFFLPLNKDSFANCTSSGPNNSTLRKTRKCRLPRVKVLTINCRSLRSEYKRCEFISIIDSYQPDIINVTETHLSNESSSAKLNVPGYEIF